MALSAHVVVCLLLCYRYLYLMSCPHHPNEEPTIELKPTLIDPHHHQFVPYPLDQHPIV